MKSANERDFAISRFNCQHDEHLLTYQMVFVGLKVHSRTAMCIALQPNADACSGMKDKQSSAEQLADVLLLVLGLSVCLKTFMHAPHMMSGLIPYYI